jgi:hypothetical protein
MSGVPAGWFFIVLDCGVTVTVFLVLIGLFTRLASVSLSVFLLTGEGLAFSFGKIDHSILFVIVPLLGALLGWGDRLSADSLRQQSQSRSTDAMPQWPLRAMALATGIAFMMAALPKIGGGWLETSSQASYAYEVQRVERGRSEWLAHPMSTINAPVAWELLDLATVALEFGLIILVLWWPAWRVGLALATVFHLGVLLTLNIDFWMNIVAYGSFVLWSRIPAGPLRSLPAKLRQKPRLYGAIAGVAVSAFAVLNHVSLAATEYLGWLVVVIGAVISLSYLARQIARLLNRRPGNPVPARPRQLT